MPSPPPPPPAAIVARVPAPTIVAARDGRVVFGVRDTRRGVTSLVVRRDGVTRRLPIAPLRTTVPVDLGTGTGGRIVATYPRCRTAAVASCHLAVLALDGGHERAVAGTAGATLGAVSGRRVAFVRAERGGRDELWTGSLYGVALRRVALPRLAAGSSPAARNVRIVTLDATGADLAFTIEFGIDDGFYSETWLVRAGRRPRRLATVSTGLAAQGTRRLFAPRLSRRSLVVFQDGRFDLPSRVKRFALSGRLLRTARIPLRHGQRLNSAVWDRGRLVFSVRGDEGGPGHFGVVERSGRLVLRSR